MLDEHARVSMRGTFARVVAWSFEATYEVT